MTAANGPGARAMPRVPVSRLVFDKHSSGGRVLSAENLGALCKEMGLELSPIDVKKAHIVLDVSRRCGPRRSAAGRPSAQHR
jgi:hypothetical protein